LITLTAFALASVITFAVGLQLNETYSSGVATLLDLVVFALTFFYSYKLMNHLRNG